MATKTRRRLQPDVREQMILDMAAQFFAIHGFSAQMRELARYIGISPALIFRYFGSKKNLIERVYESLYIVRWDGRWMEQLADRSVPLRDRLKAFYRAFFQISDDYDWVRCGLHSSLSGGDLARRHYEARVTPILQVIAAELRFGRGDRSASPPGEPELEAVWHLHSTFVYYAIRKHVHRRPVWNDHHAMVEYVVDLFLDGATATSHE